MEENNERARVVFFPPVVIMFFLTLVHYNIITTISVFYEYITLEINR